MIGLLRTVQKKISDEDVMELLNQIKSFKEKEQWLGDNRSRIQEFVGQLYIGDNTDWMSIRSQLNNMKQVFSRMGEVPLELQNNLVNGSVNFKEILEINARIEAYIKCSDQEKRFMTKRDGSMLFQTMYADTETIVQYIDCISSNVDKVNNCCNKSIDCSELFSILEKIIETHKIQSQISEEEELLKKYLSQNMMD